MKFLKRAATLFLICLITFVLLELLSWVYVSRNLRVESRSELRTIKRDHLATITRETSPRTAAQRIAEGDFSFGNRLHPYFGYTYDDESEPYYRNYINAGSSSAINNFGFLSLHENNYPYVADEDEFVVGIFGASVAMQIYASEENQKRISDALLPILKPKGYNRVTVLCMAIGGQKEPQGLFILLYYMNMVDMGIFIEGLNEATLLHNLPNYPLDFPWWNCWNVLASKEHSPYMMNTVGELRLLIRRDTAITKYFCLPLVRQSYFCHLAWNAATSVLRNRENVLRNRISDEARKGWSYKQVAPPGYGIGKQIDIYFQNYKRFVLATHLASRPMGVPCYFVLQPSEHLNGSKPLTKLEMEKCYRKNDLSQSLIKVNLYYPRLRKIYNELAKEGVCAIDLTNVFARVTEPIYVDNSSHVNGLGVRMIGNAIAEQILQKKEGLNIVPLASKRPWRLVRRD